VDGGAAEGVGLESTVVECSADGAEDDGKGWVTILRPGGVTREMLEQVAGAGRVRLDPALVQSTVQVDALQAPVQSLPKQTARRGAERAHVSELLGSPSSSSAAAAAAASSSSPSPSPVPPVVSPGPKAPGMKYTHYAPRAPLLLVEDGASDNASPSSMIDLLLRTAASYVARGDVVGILATAASRPSIEVWLKAQGLSPSQQVVVQWCGTGRVTESDLGSVARDLYACLRAFDDTAVQIILSESFPEAGGLGEAVMNRLRKAAGGRVVRQQQAADASASAATPNKP
jgi:L-threonylcarbamoyladenylate synthase